MFSKIVSALGGGLFDSIAKMVDNLTTTDAEKLEASRQLLQLQQDFQLKVLDAENEFTKTQAGVITAEVSSQSALARNWRPILMLTFTFIVAFNYIVSPLFHLQVLPLPPDMWDLMKIGMGGYIVGRTAEKVVPTIADAIATKSGK